MTAMMYVEKCEDRGVSKVYVNATRLGGFGETHASVSGSAQSAMLLNVQNSNFTAGVVNLRR